MADNTAARRAIAALREGRTPMEQIGGKDSRPDLQDVEELLSVRNMADRGRAGLYPESIGLRGPMREIEARWNNGASIAVGGQGQDSSDPAWWWVGVTPGATIGSQGGAR